MFILQHGPAMVEYLKLYIKDKAGFFTLRRFFWLIIILTGVLIIFGTYRMAENHTLKNLQIRMDFHFWLFVLAGFLAQLIDGALGMAYGVSCSSMLIAFNVPPVISSASVHISEVFTTGASGLSHLRFKNVHRQLLMKLLIPGILGASLGAFLLSEYFNGDWIKPFVSAYLMVLGLLILRKAFFRPVPAGSKVKNVRWLALSGGFLDAIGGGGWGPVVVSNLIHQGANPKRTIGSANTAEFFIALVSSAVFISFIKITNWQPVIGILTGGIIAAPFAAFFVKMIRPKPLMIIVGCLITCISLYNIYKSIPMFEGLLLKIF
jgi:uncharacterized membrane protein YfcA